MIKFKNIAIAGFSVVFALGLVACNNNKKLPFYGQREAKIVKDAAGVEKVDTVYQTIPDFKLLNQDSVMITQDQFKNKVYVADFFFTSCTTICPTMHRNLKTVYEAYKDNPEVAFLSHTIDFKYDKPSVLKKYAEKLGVDTQKWTFVYGSKDEIYHLAEHNYLVAVQEDSTAKDGYIHQGWLVLVDKHKRMRGAYDGTKTEEVEKLKKDIATLLAEKE
ncbi:SCO family protein [Pedobacter sp. KR3-3]|uniref:SCO family protein n=1 Tax=Pedobacter albus TaxID=3113905 RepID=A0ABU7I3G3_9SPHI|nr:SCO family protein [Pedobacter sp. KR3-3]MEE1944007.1 SCO family protein [Pedobacter sp. KR3-3]